MTTYISWEELANAAKRGVVLEEGDKVVLCDDTYAVQESHLDNSCGSNEEVFRRLSMDKYAVAKAAYGYACSGGNFPCFKDNDGRAAMQIALLLRAIEEGKCTKNNYQENKKYWDIDVLKSDSSSNDIGIEFTPGMRVHEYIKKLLVVVQKAAKKKDATEEMKTRAKMLSVYQRCILPERVRTQVEAALVVALRRNIFEEWGFDEHFEKGLTNAMLLHGPPGTGKTMLSESIAAVLGKNLMLLSTADLQSQIPGQMERNIKAAFAQAAKCNSVLLLDECDSLLMNRDRVGFILGSEINALLTEIERFDGVVILTTNRVHTLDPALARRIVSKVEVLPPEKAARVEIWKTTIPTKMPLAEGIDFEKLADARLTGGEIKNAVLLAARYAIADVADRVTMQHFSDAVESVLDGKDAFEQTTTVLAKRV
jgi:ATP-dependent 26S proteasome regulatory subunit